MLLGNKIRSLRDEQGILQRQVAAYLEIDNYVKARNCLLRMLSCRLQMENTISSRLTFWLVLSPTLPTRTWLPIWRPSAQNVLGKSSR